MFYLKNRQKEILKIGSSVSYSTHPVLHSIHAEEFALAYIKKIQYQYNIKDIIIFIWKQNTSCEIKPVYCCLWCSKIVKKSGFPIKNIITISDTYTSNPLISISQPAICEEKARQPLTKRVEIRI